MSWLQSSANMPVAEKFFLSLTFDRRSRIRPTTGKTCLKPHLPVQCAIKTRLYKPVTTDGLLPMHWQEEKDEERKQTKISSKVSDLCFKIDCRSLPIDHGWILQEALEEELPWLANEPFAAIHDIHGAESGNGWIRPSGGDVIYLSRRARLRIRLPNHRIDDAKLLEHRELKLAEYILTIGASRVLPLIQHKTLFARYLPDNALNEDTFLDAVIQMLAQKRIHPPRIMSGKQRTMYTPKGNLNTRSVMIDGLDPASSLLLQEEGLGLQHRLGCGIFLPHKGIGAVYKLNNT